MKHLKVLSILFLAICVTLLSCDVPQESTPQSTSGVSKATVKVATDLNGHTTEQSNIMERYKRDNLPGSIKHLYLISDYSGQCLMYSTVKGKVTSSGKRLSPVTVSALDGQYVSGGHQGFSVDINGEKHYTQEVLQDDGTYGSSSEYLYWFDSRGIYRQLYATGGTTIIVSDQPMAFKNITLNLEIDNK